MSSPITPSANSTTPTITIHGIQAGSRGSTSELIRPTPSPTATMTNIVRRTIRATFVIARFQGLPASIVGGRQIPIGGCRDFGDRQRAGRTADNDRQAIA